MGKDKILVINPGSTSTKLAVFQGNNKIIEESLSHSTADLAPYQRVADQFDFRYQAVMEFLAEKQVALNELLCISARGGLLKPISGGTYQVNEGMCMDIRTSGREHASNLGALIAKAIGDQLGIPAFIVDPVVVDEMDDLARLSGLAGYGRRAIWHPLNQKATVRKAAVLLGKTYAEVTCIAVHMGGGVTVGLHKKGRAVDVNNGLDGDGAYSPERCGGLPTGVILDLVFEEQLNRAQVMKRLAGQGGCVSYLGTNDARVIEKMVMDGDAQAELVYRGMAYQISKEIGALAAAAAGQVDAILLTGGMAYSRLFTSWIRERVEFIAPVYLFPGEGEMEALKDGAKRVMDGTETAKIYE